MGESKFPVGKFSQFGRVLHITAAFGVFVVAAAFSPAIAQTQYSIGNPTNEQQYMLELVRGAGGTTGIAVVEV